MKAEGAAGAAAGGEPQWCSGGRSRSIGHCRQCSSAGLCAATMLVCVAAFVALLVAAMARYRGGAGGTVNSRAAEVRRGSTSTPVTAPFDCIGGQRCETSPLFDKPSTNDHLVWSRESLFPIVTLLLRSWGFRAIE